MLMGYTGVFSRRSVAGDSTPRGTNSSRGATYGQNVCISDWIKEGSPLMRTHSSLEQAW